MYGERFINCFIKYGVTCYKPDGQPKSKNEIWNDEDLNSVWRNLSQEMRDEIVDVWHEENKFD